MRLLLLLVSVSLAALGQSRLDRWAAILESKPVAAQVSSRAELATAKGLNHRAAVSLEQRRVVQNLEQRKIRILGSSNLLVNAVYFTGDRREAEAVRGMPGVARVVRMKAYRRAADDTFPQISQAPQAWSTLGGEGSAGAGRRIGILDSGIDQAHPSFQDASLSAPAGFPRANTDADLAYTNHKVIVARSYVDMLVAGDRPDISRPDDTSPRDRSGHGTAVASIAAGTRVTGPAATITGIAPKAFLGNYKIFGSPGVNDVTFTDVIIRALEDAAVDGMDVVTLSLGAPASWGALDNFCGQQGNQPCDPQADAINALVRDLGIAVVAPAGNAANDGFNFPALGSIESPGTAPDVITVGAITNGNVYYQSVIPQGGSRINALFGNGPLGAVSGVGQYVGTIGPDGFGCRPLGTDTLQARIALIDRGECTLEQKVNNAQRAGAAGVVIIQAAGNESVFRSEGLQFTTIPSVLVGHTAGQNLKTLLSSNPNLQLSLDPAFVQNPAPTDEIAIFSSQGPAMFSLETNSVVIKPELTAVGTDIYAATQRYDPNGGEFSSDGYIALSGTSFAVPIAAGTAALVRQKNPGWTATMLKSAITNTANPEVDDFDSNNQRFLARINSTGAGKIDAGQALNAVVTADPATISFGVVTQIGIGRDLRLTNGTNANATLTVSVQPRDPDDNADVVISNPQFSLAPGQTTQLSVRLEGSRPNPGSYEGVIVVNGAGPPMRIPYLYMVGDGVVHNAYALGNNFLTAPGRSFRIDENPLLVKMTDRFGVPVRGVATRWTAVSGGGRIDTASENTDDYGVTAAGVTLGPEIGEQEFRVEAGGVSATVFVQTIPQPAIRSGGIVNGASNQPGQGLAPGSYISIYGTGLSPVSQAFYTPYLPVAIAGVSVSFDAPDRRISAPGRLSYVSDGQVNVQVPWEMNGITTAQMKISIGDLSSAVFNVPLNQHSPGIFEYQDSTSGRLLSAALDESNRVISGSNPVSRGSVAQLYVNGLGPVSSTPPSGEPAPSSPLATTLAVPEVVIGGRPAAVQFSGLAPGYVGLYQVNVFVPADAPAGIQPISISIGGVTSQTSQIALR